MSTITTNFTKIWLQQRSLIFVKATNGAAYADLYNGIGTRLARYTLNAKGETTIDVTDYMRAYQSNTSFKVQIAGESMVTINTPIGGLIDPDGEIIPHCPHARIWKIAPPSMMLQGLPYCDIYFEAYGYNSDRDAQYYTPIMDEPEVIGRSNQMPYNSRFLSLEEHGEEVARIQLKPLDCSKTYAAVEWTSASGVKKLHTFECRSMKSSVYGAFSLQTADGSFNTRKGREEGFSLFLDGLTTYDLWYYSDIITSSSVKVSFDGTSWRQVDVETNSLTIPNGDASFSKLSVSVKYRRYDAI